MKIIKRAPWGRIYHTKSKCFRLGEFSLDIKNNTKSGLAVGLGRSYGDSSLNSNGVYYSLSDFKNIQIDRENKIAICGAGATIGDLERIAIKQKLFPLTVPGTEFVTIGGAIASNIHGKSHHIDGSFGESVLEITLIKSNGEKILLSPEGAGSNKFWATVGGMGLTGIITEAKIKLRTIETSFIKVEEKRAKNLSMMMALMREFDKKYLYTVAWIDLSGKFCGRGRVLGGNHAKISELPAKKKYKNLKIGEPKKIYVPLITPFNLINPISVRIFNLFWYQKFLKKNYVKIRAFFHPLDSIRNWNRVYGISGLRQFQFQIPFKNEFFLYEVLLELRKNRSSSFLGVLKKFGPGDKSFLGFPEIGWTLTIDFPAEDERCLKSIEILTKRLTELSGKVYLSKDSLLKENEFNTMYPKKNNWKKIKADLDPSNYWQSDQGRRLGLC